MDRDHHELQFLGFGGIFRESFNIIFARRKLFSQITLALILPLCVIYLAHSEISQVLFFHILDHEITRDDTFRDSPRYDDSSHMLKSEWIAFWLFKAAYFVCVLIFSLLSTSAVVYTVACMHSGKQMGFKKIMGVVPRVWKRLIVTFLWTFAVFFVYNLVSALLLLAIIAFAAPQGPAVGITIAVIFFILYFVGFVYITMVWQLASVVSVLEPIYGRKAMLKSKNLMKGKMCVSVGCFLGLFVCFGLVEALFECFVVLQLVPGIGIRIGVGLVCLLLLLKVFLFSLVVQTVLYFVCKSYHHEIIERSTLSDHLEVYLGDYVPLKAKDVQLEQIQHV